MECPDMLEFIADREIYQKVICDYIPKATRCLWLATADLKAIQKRKRLQYECVSWA